MTLPRSLLDAYAAHVADENAQAATALFDANAATTAAQRHVLLDARHDAQLRSQVWQQAYNLAEPHAHFPRQVRLGSPGDGEVGDGDR